MRHRVGMHVLRYGLALVFLYFGVMQFVDPMNWVNVLPDWLLKYVPLSAVTIVMLNAVFEIVCAALLILGVRVRDVAFLLAAHLAIITGMLGFTPIGVRDFGLTAATLALALLEKGKE